MISTKVMITEKAEKQLSQVPHYIRDKLYQWVERVEVFGFKKFAKLKDFMMKPCKECAWGKDPYASTIAIGPFIYRKPLVIAF